MINLVFARSTSQYEGIADLTGSVGNIAAEPLLVFAEAEPGRADFAITGHSPAVNAGGEVDGVITDYDGLSRLRPGDAAPDIGAYEYQPESVRLAVGWTLIGWPTEARVEDLAAPLGGNLEALFTWDPDESRFATFRPSGPEPLNTLRVIEAGQGVWVLSLRPQTLILPSPRPSATALRAGFNLVAAPGGEPDPAAAFGDLAGLEAVFRWDPLRQRYESWAPGRLPILNTLTTLRVGEGLWLSMRTDQLWSP